MSKLELRWAAFQNQSHARRSCLTRSQLRRIQLLGRTFGHSNIVPTSHHRVIPCRFASEDPSCINPLHPWTIFSITRSIACCEFLQNCSLKQPDCWVIHIQGRIGESRPRFECRAAPFGHLIKGSCMCYQWPHPYSIVWNAFEKTPGHGRRVWSNITSSRSKFQESI